MFTGLVQAKGQIIKKEDKSNFIKFRIKTNFLDDVSVGDSIAVNGLCLTAKELSNDFFDVDVMTDSIKVSNLESLDVGEFVNLEKAMKLGDRLGGHMVSGHIDGKARIEKIVKENGSYRFFIRIYNDLDKYIVHKGSITLDGISLTISENKKDMIQVSIIPHTWEHTTMKLKKVGDIMNVEVDMMFKYVEKMVMNYNLEVDKNAKK
jgi:riboflavin synthase